MTEGLGRNDVLTFEDAHDLTRLHENQQYARGVHYNTVVSGDGTISIYVGSATGAQGFVQKHLVHHHWTSLSLPLGVNPAFL
jgi:hypothetical protein